MRKFWKLDVSAVPDSHDGSVKYTDQPTAVGMAKQVSANNGNARIVVMEAMELVVGDDVTELQP